MIKLIAIDLDGTLLNEEKNISQTNLNALKLAQEQGITIMISSGREFAMVKDLLKKYELVCPAAVLNGSEIRDEKGKLLKQVFMDNVRAREVSRVFRKHKVVSRIYTGSGFYTFDNAESTLEELTDRIMVFFPALSREEAKERAGKETNFQDIRYIEEEELFWHTESVKKVVSFHRQEQVILRIREELKKIPELAVTSSFQNNIEVTAEDAQKGEAVYWYAKRQQILPNEVMVIGDNMNDESMFLKFEHSVAMGNAASELMTIAKYLTKTNEEDGVAYAVQKVLSSEWVRQGE